MLSCSQCRCPIPSSRPGFQLDCSHCFCQICLQVYQWGTHFLCPYDHRIVQAHFLRPHVPRPVSAKFRYHKLPKWFYRQRDSEVSVVLRPPTNRRYKKVEALFHYSSPTKTVVKIERIQNKHQYQLFANKHEAFSMVESRSLKLMHLFHGTSQTPPSTVYSSLTGLDSRLGSGEWGQGTYYARNSSLSIKYFPHALPDGCQQIFCMLVLVGDACDMRNPSAETRSLVRPPTKQGTNSLYHSVKGYEEGSDVYMTYEPNMSYPYFLITYR